ncbi:MAG: exonuclease domain-containing protein [bacterium]
MVIAEEQPVNEISLIYIPDIANPLQKQYNITMFCEDIEADIVALDLETTGLSSRHDRIVEFAAVRWRAGVEMATFQSLCHPGRHISAEVIRVHGITNEMVADAPSEAQVLPDFLDFCAQADVVVAHNAPFDMGFIRTACERVGLECFNVPVVDSCNMARHSLPGSPSYSLTTLKRLLNIDTGRAHRALEDARACLYVYLHCLLRTPLPLNRLRELNHLPQRFALIEEAMNTKSTVVIEYCDTRGTASRRAIQPQSVLGGVVVAHCLLRGELRHFTMERIGRIWKYEEE